VTAFLLRGGAVVAGAQQQLRWFSGGLVWRECISSSAPKGSGLPERPAAAPTDQWTLVLDCIARRTASPAPPLLTLRGRVKLCSVIPDPNLNATSC
jgi:hypothetical protein